MTDIFLGFSILCLCFCVWCQYQINKEFMRVIDSDKEFLTKMIKDAVTERPIL